jgi:hypothetical protein
MVLVTLTTPNDLYTLMIAPNVGPSGTYSLLDNYELGNDIDMSGFVQPAKSIGYTDTGNGFQGTFDGKGYTVTIDTVDANDYYGFFSFTLGLIQNLTVVYKNDGITINGTISGEPTGAFVGETGSNITNCHVVLGNNVIIRGNFAVGGFVGNNAGDTITNCSLQAGNNLSIIYDGGGGDFVGGFTGRMNGGTLNSCNCVIGNNLTITGYDLGGLTGDGSIINNTSLTIGDNCTLDGTQGIGQGGYVGGIIGDTEYTGCSFNNVKAIYGNNTTIIGDLVGGIAGEITPGTDSMTNCIILYKNNTRLLGSSLGGGILARGAAVSNTFGLFNDYSITGNQSSAIYGEISSPTPAPSVLTNSCGNPLPGSNVTNMSTTSLDAIIGYLEGIPYLQSLIPYIRQTYCVAIPAVVPLCPCTADLCNSNPQNTNYNESEDKSRITDQTIRNNVDVQLQELQNGSRVCGMPIFRSYDDMMKWKQGACKYRR